MEEGIAGRRHEDMQSPFFEGGIPMTRKLTRKFRRLAVVVAFAALMIPATAIAHPMGNTGRDASSQSQPQTYVLIEGKWQPQDLGNVSQSAGSYVPADPGQARLTDTGTQSRPSSPVTKTVQVPADSGFGWTDALIGAGVTAAILLLALAGAIGLRRQDKLSYR
jgi:hypothetical protein